LLRAQQGGFGRPFMRAADLQDSGDIVGAHWLLVRFPEHVFQHGVEAIEFLDLVEWR
jgi:hypothetical protein